MKNDELIEEILRLKQGNKEIALFHFSECDEGDEDEAKWVVMLGSTNSHVLLGECGGEYYAEGETMNEALTKLLSNLKLGIKEVYR